MNNKTQNQYFTVSNYLSALTRVFESIDLREIDKGIEMVKAAFENGKKIITCGNGGSALTASHYVTDWNKMVYLSSGKKFRGVSLCDNAGLITAYGNDLSYVDIFSGQVEAMLDEGDLLIAISGSGNSPNVLRAVEVAKSNGGQTLGIVGYDGGKLLPMCDNSVWVRSFDMQLCEDFHLIFGHMVMKSLCGYSIK